MIASASLAAFSAGVAAPQRSVAPVGAAVIDVTRQKSTIGTAPPAGNPPPGQLQPGTVPPRGLPRGSLLDRSV